MDTKKEKRRDALGLLVESLHKADSRLRGCAHTNSATMNLWNGVKKSLIT